MSRIIFFAGGVAASATAGALIAMGRRLGRASVPYVAISETLARRSSSGGVGAVLTGFIVHVLVTLLWTLVFVWLADRLNRTILPAIIVGAANFFASWIVAHFTGFGLATVLPLGDRLTLSATLAIALMLGMRYARSSTRIA